jgi:hypothetical protein
MTVNNQLETEKKEAALAEFMGGLKKTLKNLSYDSRCADGGSNPVLSDASLKRCRLR